jgi:hypothetical protein
MEFVRSVDLVYPQIYKTFLAGDEEFYIADLTEDHADEAWKLIEEFVIPEENFCKAVQIHTKPNAMKVMENGYRELLKQKVSLGCFKKKTDELVGLNILSVKVKGQESVRKVS